MRTGNHSLCELLMCNDYQIDADRETPLNLALELRRWDFVDLLLEFE